MQEKTVHVIGGGTVSYIRTHLALSAPAYGETARKIAMLCKTRNDSKQVILHLTKMADSKSCIETNEDLRSLVFTLMDDMRVNIVFFNPAVVDFNAQIENVKSEKYAERLHTSDNAGNALQYDATLIPSTKLISLFRKGGEGRNPRKDIFLVGFKATAGATPEEQYRQGLTMLKASSANLILANDVTTRLNMIIVPEEATYHVTTNREEALQALIEMAYLRSNLTFTQSTVVQGDPISWESDLVPASLRTVVNHCIARGAYKPFRGATAGHFAVKINDTSFLTSRRKTDFNAINHVGLVKIETNGQNSVISYGDKPSVGGQSQRIVFAEHPDVDCIVHFHCPKKSDSQVPTFSQREYECGSHECGKNTSRGLGRFDNLLAVYLDNHGPNLVFNRSADPQQIISFIENNFELTQKTGGYAIT